MKGDKTMSKSTKTGASAMLNLIAILAIFLVSGVGNFQNPAIATFQAAWPDVSATAINNVSTLPALISLPVMLIVGAVAGKKVKYKPIVLLALICSLVGGLGPMFFAPSWTVVLVFRAILGIGAGCFGVRSAILLSSLEESQRATWVGIGTALYSGVNLVMGPVVGALTRVSWKAPFGVNALCIVTLVMVLFFMQEPETEAAPAEETEAAPAAKEPLGTRPVIYAILQAIATGVMYPLLLGISTFFVNKNIGDGVMAGTVITCYSIGCLASMVLGPVQKVFKRLTLPVAYLVAAAGVAIVLFFPGFMTACIGSIIAGAGFMIAFSMLQVFNAQVCGPTVLALASTLILVGNNLGVYISSYCMTFFHAVFGRPTVEESAFFGDMVVFIIFAVLAFIPGLIVPKEKEA